VQNFKSSEQQLPTVNGNDNVITEDGHLPFQFPYITCLNPDASLGCDGTKGYGKEQERLDGKGASATHRREFSQRKLAVNIAVDGLLHEAGT
jgi:hypothetical protein